MLIEQDFSLADEKHIFYRIFNGENLFGMKSYGQRKRLVFDQLTAFERVRKN